MIKCKLCDLFLYNFVNLIYFIPSQFIILKKMFQDLTSLVLDIGTYKSKIGYGGDDAPKLITNSYVSRNN